MERAELKIAHLSKFQENRPARTQAAVKRFLIAEGIIAAFGEDPLSWHFVWTLFMSNIAWKNRSCLWGDVGNCSPQFLKQKHYPYQEERKASPGMFLPSRLLKAHKYMATEEWRESGAGEECAY